MANMARNALTCTAAPFKHDGSSLLLQGFNQILLSVFMKTLFANGATRNISFPTSSEEGICSLMRRKLDFFQLPTLKSFKDSFATYLWHHLVNITKVNKVEAISLSHLQSIVSLLLYCNWQKYFLLMVSPIERTRRVSINALCRV